jgi:hypothetical protein
MNDAAVAAAKAKAEREATVQAIRAAPSGRLTFAALLLSKQS